jgi:ADP-ribosyl-[dinitrogen reductase] hydrolase
VVLATLNRLDYFNEWSLQQSHITHNNPLSNAATLTLGHIVNHLINGHDMAACIQEAERLISQYSEFSYNPYSGKASGYIVDTVQTVLHYFFGTDSFESCLIATVNQGGDADTTGALVGMLAGAKYGVQQIPERWLTQLDQQLVAQIRQQTTGLIRLAGLL